MPEPNNENKETPGVILKAAREARGLSLESLHEMTKIPLDVIKAIEEGYKVRTLSPFYLRGFIKKYAQQVGVDVKAVIEDYESEQLPKPIKKKAPGVVSFIEPEKFFTKKRQQQIVIIVGVLLLLFCIVKIAGCIRNKGGDDAVKKKTAVTKSADQQKKKKQKKVKAAEPKKKKKKASRPRTPEKKPAASSKKAAAVANVKAVNLTLRANKKGWLQVKVDGNLVFQSTLKEGVTETWHADKIIEISGKNINDLELELNGKILGPLGRADRKARRVVVTKDGLSVKK